MATGEREQFFNRFTGLLGETPRAPEFTARSWSDSIMRMNCHVCLEVFEASGRLVSPLPDGVRTGRGRQYDIFREVYRLEQGLDFVHQSAKGADRYRVHKAHYLKALAKEINKARDFRVLPQLRELLTPVDLPNDLRSYFLADVTALYLLLSEREFLVGIKDSPHWRKLTWPDDRSSEVHWAFILGNVYFANIGYIGERELPTVPLAPIDPGRIRFLQFPRSERSIEETLEAAYYGQRYLVPEEGAEVFLRSVGDVDRMFLVQSGRVLLAKVVTKYGEGFVRLHLEDADWFSSFEFQNRPLGVLDPVEITDPASVALVAEVYRDLVTAVELPVERYLPLGGMSPRVARAGTRGDTRPQIYIPRVTRIRGRQQEFARSRYEGPLRPVSPHRVRGHSRKGPMTERHRQVLATWFAARDLRMPQIPEGSTYVRPYTVPAEDPEVIRKLPVFIRRRIVGGLNPEMQSG